MLHMHYYTRHQYIYIPWLGGVYARYTTCCGGGSCGYNPRPVRPRGISTQTSEHQQVVHVYLAYTPTSHGSYSTE